MKIPTEPNFKSAVRQAQLLLRKEKVNRLPVDPFQIANRNGWGPHQYFHRFEKDSPLNDGFIIPDKNGEIKIHYNGNVSLEGRKRWTIAHEIGHIILHKDKYEINEINRHKEENGVLEVEANTFAAELLAPMALLKIMGVTTWDQIMDVCELSYVAAVKREEQIRKMSNWYVYKSSMLWMRTCFSDYLEPLGFKNLRRIGQSIWVNELHCNKCGYAFESKDAKFCPICGNNHLEKGMGDRKMIYDGYEVDDNGRAFTCPMCDNEQLEYEGDFCNVCGNIIVNKCTKEVYYENELVDKCETIAEGNARYCRKCGEETTFYQQQFLQPWSVAQEELRNEIEEEEQAEINEMVGRELPF